MPTAWYTVHLDSAPQGTVGNTAASITSGNLHVNPAFDSTNSGTGLVYAASASDAIRTALTGGVVVNLSAVSLPPASYTFTEGTSSPSTSNHVAFAVTPTVASSVWKVYLEDLTAAPAVSDWDYNDFFWTVSVGDGTAPPNSAPTAANDFASTSLNTPVTVAALANDHDTYGGTLAVVSAGVNGATIHGTVAIAADGASVIYTPNAGFSGTDSFSYTVDDHFGGQATALVTVTVHEQPLVTVTGPSTVVPDAVLPTATIPFTLHWVGESAASSTDVSNRITVSDGAGFTNEVSSQTLTTTFAPGQTSFDSTLSLANTGTVRQVKIEVLPPIPGIPPPYTLDPTDSVFLCQVQAKAPPTSATLTPDHFETRNAAPPAARDGHAWVSYTRKFEPGRRTFTFTQVANAGGIYTYDAKIAVYTSPVAFLAVFNQAASGLLVGQDMTDELFAHEKLHLQIAEYAARKATDRFVPLLMAMTVRFTFASPEKPTDNMLVIPASAAMEPEEQELAEAWMVRYTRLDQWAQAAYDTASNHSENAVGQADWAAKYKRYMDTASLQMGWNL